MDIEKYLKLDIEPLEKVLVSDLMATPKESTKIVNALKETHRYGEDPLFCVCVDAVELLTYSLTGNFVLLLSAVEGVVERAEELEQWRLVSLSLNQMGGAYFAHAMFEQAMEVFHRVILNEKKHGLHFFRSVAYNNIAIILMNFRGGDRAKANLEQAIETLKAGGEDQSRYFAKLMVYKCNLAGYYASVEGKEAEEKQLLEEIEAEDFSKLTPEDLYTVYRTTFYYHLRQGNIEKGKELFLKTLEHIPASTRRYRISTMSTFVEECLRQGVDFSVYEDFLMELERYERESSEGSNLDSLKILRDHYRALGDVENVRFFQERYIHFLEEYIEIVRESRLSSLNIVLDVLNTKRTMEDVEVKNSHLSHVAEEAIRHKEESQKAYHHIQLIHELGRKLTSSTNLESVVDLIHGNLSQSIPMNTFILMVSDKEKRELRSIAYYDGERKLAELSFRWEDPNSLFAECCRSRETIVIEDFFEDPRFYYRKILLAEKQSVKSGVFLPLIVEGEVIGAFSVQDRKVAAYGEKELKFLDLLTPYLAIALNNGLYSQRLEREIRERIQVEKELKETNQKLERLSSLDGLTQVANRREFERRLLKLLDEARTNEHSVSIFMLDIDNFKKYNDAYGHLQGDEVLKLVANAVRENIEKAGGLSARFGGEEFIAACSNLSVAESLRLAEKICAEIRALEIENSAVALGKLSLSIGVGVGVGRALENKSLLMRHADEALYEAKRSGKNRAVVNPVFAEE